MANYEEELKRIAPVAKFLTNLSLLGKRIALRGEENFIRSGPNIIVGNHIGTFKDIAVVYRIVPRSFFFTANKMLFDREELNSLIKKHLRLHLKGLGPVLDTLLSPIKSCFVNYVSTNIAKVGTIPVDLTRKKRLAIEACQDYLKKRRAIIALQGHGRVTKGSPHPYVSPFRRGVPIIAYNLLQEERIRVPVTPVAMYGTQKPLFIPAKIRVSVGEPMYITDYMGNSFDESVDRFREAMEERVKSLLAEML